MVGAKAGLWTDIWTGFWTERALNDDLLHILEKKAEIKTVSGREVSMAVTVLYTV